MYLSELQIQNFRQFGDGEESLQIRFNIGVTALVGQNDSGKSTVIDAIRYVLLTRDQESIRVQPEDFHIGQDGQMSTEIHICCKMSGLTADDKGAFLEYLSYDNGEVSLYVHWIARKLSDMPSSRRWVDVTVRSGKSGAGPVIDTTQRSLLAVAYLRPLRDAEREMAPGRNSRLSQVLANVPEIREGRLFDQDNLPKDETDVAALSLLGLFDYLGHSVQQHVGIRNAQETINDQYLSSLSLQQQRLKGRIAFFTGGTDDAKLRQVLERLELRLFDDVAGSAKGRSGLGSNNLLFMACELLLLGHEPDGLALLLIEEPEAHLHPQRQLRLMEFLHTASEVTDDIGRNVQVVLTTHSPNLASKIQLENMVLLDHGRAFSFSSSETKLDKSDYRFLQRFLDVTKANLFFAHGVLIVEGDAEAILIPTLAKIMGRDLTEHGVSIVNVGGTGLRRFGRILQASDRSKHPITIPVACVTDLDVMPDCAPQIIGLVTGDNDPAWSSLGRRKWRALRDLGATQEEVDLALASRRRKLSDDDGANVRTFIADHWTLEYDLAFHGLAEAVFVAARLAQNDDPLNEERKARADIVTAAKEEFGNLKTLRSELDSLCSEVYRLFAKGGASKAVAAQYLAENLLAMQEQGEISEETLRQKLPNYLIEAIEHATSHGIQVEVNQHGGEEQGGNE